MLVTPPRIVLEGPESVLARAIGELVRDGWRIEHGFRTGRASLRTARGSREVRVGTVRSVEDAAAAMLTVLAGAGVVIHACAPPEVLDPLLDDLRHVGPVDHRRAPRLSLPALGDEAREILVILAQGRTLGDAAATLGLSRRTADRRLAEARSALGVERTVEAVALARRMGWLG